MASRDEIVVKITFPYPDWPINRQLPIKKTVFEGVNFCINDKSCIDADYWFVFEDLLAEENVNVPKDNIYFITAEPPSFKKYKNKFLNQFSHVITCQRNIKHKDTIFLHQGHPWFIDQSFDEIIETSFVPKNKSISVITSDKQIQRDTKRGTNSVID